MKKTVLISLAALFAVLSCPRVSAQYSDHRGRNVDSLEVDVARWTAADIQSASDSELGELVNAYNGLMQGYLQINGVKSEYYARKMMDLATSKGWQSSIKDAAKVIGQHFWAREQYDSAAVYYNIALEALGKMASGATSPTDPEGYDQEKIDDGYSSMYGTLGNLFNMMGDLDKAFDYYAKAGEIFDRYGWNESNAVLHYNMGETWYEEGDYDKARECYEKALEYGRTAGDSLWIASPLKGLGLVYFTQGKTSKGLRCLEEADKYFSLHEDQEFRARLETLGIMENALKAQRRQLVWIACILAVALLLTAGFILLARKLRKSRQDNKEVGEVLEETLEEISPKPEGPILSDREKQILQLMADGLTGPQIADKVCLSPETIKWYRKKLLVKFNAANTPELISKAKDAHRL